MSWGNLSVLGWQTEMVGPHTMSRPSILQILEPGSSPTWLLKNCSLNCKLILLDTISFVKGYPWRRKVKWNLTKQGAAEHGAPSRKPRNGATHTHAERPECVSPKRVSVMCQRSHVTQTPLPTLSPSSAARGARARHRAEPLGLAGARPRPV